MSIRPPRAPTQEYRRRAGSYNTPGLSYPAASPSVVPVASVTNAGSFSSFSQRHDRVIAAPGSSITSTVPNY